MKLNVTRNPEIPGLAWICTLERGRRDAALECGESVDVDTDWFFEGVWAGELTAGDFLENTCFGTGARLVGDGIVFTPPDHILDRLCIWRDADRVVVSNSLPFLMQRCGLDLETDRADHFEIFGNIRFGLDHARTPLPLAGGGHVELWAWHHLHVAPDLTLIAREKTRVVPTSDFAAYTGFLSDQIGRIFGNAADPARRQRLSPLTTISSGYDSTMISALAAERGCTRAITFSKSRARLGKRAEDDSGTVAATALGLDVRQFDRLEFRNASGFPEIETLGAGAEMSSARDELKHSVVLTGHLGGMMWDYAPKFVSTNILGPMMGGHNLTELRLAAGFAHVCLPFVGCRQQPEIIAISQSAEMAPWTLHTAYDRPICRRVAEERNIPRGAFGIRKRAAGVFFVDEGLEATMTPQSYLDYTAFRARHAPRPVWRIRLANSWTQLSRFLNSASRKATAVLGKALGRRLTAPRLPEAPAMSTEGALLFQWSVARMKERYASRPQVG